MEQFRGAIASITIQCLKHIEDQSLDYAHREFWRMVEGELLKSKKSYKIPSWFSLWLGSFVGDVIDAHLSVDDLISCITSGSNTIGDRWLDDRVDAIGNRVGRKLSRD